MRSSLLARQHNIKSLQLRSSSKRYIVTNICFLLRRSKLSAQRQLEPERQLQSGAHAEPNLSQRQRGRYLQLLIGAHHSNDLSKGPFSGAFFTSPLQGCNSFVTERNLDSEGERDVI